MDTKLINRIAFIVFGIVGYLFEKKLIDIQNYFNDEAPIEIRKKKVEVVFKISK